MTRLLHGLLGLLVALAGLVPAGAAGAVALPETPPRQVLPAQAGGCVSAGGVWIIVIDADSKVIAQGCSTNPSSGRDALTSVTGVFEREQGFVCQINNVPNRCAASSEWTTNTPMWRYSYATPGGSWIYSNWGYTARQPPRGSLEGWCLSAGPCEAKLASILNPASLSGHVPKPTRPPTTSAPPTRTPATRAPTIRTPTTRTPTTSAPTTARTKVPNPTTAPTSTVTQPSAAPSSTPSASPRAPASSAASTASASTPATPDSSGSSGSSSLTTTVPPTPQDSPTTVVADRPAGGTGTPWGVVTTAGLIVAAAGTFGVVRIRRSRTSMDTTES